MYPVGNDHIMHFYFSVVVHGTNLKTEYFEKMEVKNVFKDQIEDLKEVTDMGSVSPDVCTRTFFVEVKKTDKPQREVESELGDLHISLRDRFAKDEHLGSVSHAYVAVTRCCNYYNGGVN